ncbi:Peptidase S9, prolyl oligopeptidase active site domain protein [Pseudoalteromonas luteoviolacea B = ATCC 29581]|nr:Peptidase S9, prolyl oligopeptidase active site domain protein [Pseudoalteromonas luteoviolacea B = ATCC 29581]
MLKRSWSAQPLSYGEFYAFNYNGRRGKMIFGARAGEVQTGSRIKKVESNYAWGELIDQLHGDERYVLLSSTPYSTDGGRLPEMIKLDVNTGVQKGFGYKAPIPSASFILKQDKSPLLAAGTDKQGDTINYFYNREKHDWEALDLVTEFQPIVASKDDRLVWGLARLDSDKLGVYTLEVATGELKSVFVDKQYDVEDVMLSTDKSQVIAARLATPFPEYVILDKTHPDADILRSMAATFPGQQVEVFNKTQDGKLALVWVGSDVTDGSLYLFDIKETKLKYLYTFRDGLSNLKLTYTDPIKFKTSDGIDIEGYFTEAKKMKDKKSNKLVVLVHGGPHFVRDTWNFDPEVHVLAQHGYNVLRVNFRGSGGRGEDFVKLGYRKWGTDIQRDIYEGVQWAIKERGIAKDKVCIMGASFGGYSAVMSPIRYPDAYQCAIANVGVYDLPMMFKEGDVPSWYAGEAFLNEVLGTDEAELIANSPARQVAKLNTPLFLAHGEKDQRAPIEHYEMLTKALNKAGKSYESFIVENEWHGFYDSSVRAKYYTNVLNFLDKHLKN